MLPERAGTFTSRDPLFFEKEIIAILSGSISMDMSGIILPSLLILKASHGYETTWKGLRNDQRAALQKAGLVTKHGRITEP
jgi:hypothetical protein